MILVISKVSLKQMEMLLKINKSVNYLECVNSISRVPETNYRKMSN